jgi:hypothetical protein
MNPFEQQTFDWHHEQYSIHEKQSQELENQISQLREKQMEANEGQNYHWAEMDRIMRQESKEHSLKSNESDVEYLFATVDISPLTKTPNESLLDIKSEFPNNKSDPKDWLREQYKGMPMDAVIKNALATLGGKAKTINIAKEVYLTKLPEELKRCRQSLGSSLRLGAEARKGWVKLGHGWFELEPMNQSHN